MSRRGGRVVEGARLEFVYAGNRIAGSNPALSATLRPSNFGRHAGSEVEVEMPHEAFA